MIPIPIDPGVCSFVVLLQLERRKLFGGRHGPLRVVVVGQGVPKAA